MSNRLTYEELEKRVHELENKVSELETLKESLQESQESYRRLVALSPDSVAINRMKDGLYLQVNDAFCRLTGYSADEILGRTAEDLNLYAEASDRERLLDALRQRGPLDGIEIRFRAKDGTIMNGLVSARRIRFRGEDCVLAVTMNITPLVNAQRALHESEEKYRNILETMEEGYYELDLTGNLTFFNDALCRLYGYPRDELMGMNYKQYLSPEEANRVYGIYNGVFTTGVPAKIFDYEVISKDGSRKIIEISSALRRNASGEPIGFRGVARDVTEKVNAVKALRESEERYRNILETMEEGFYEVDLRGNFTFLNDALCLLYGYPRDELMRMNYRQYLSQEEAERVYRILNEVFKTGVPAKIFDHEVIARDGSRKIIEISSALRRNALGEPIGFRGVARDITEKVNAQKALRESEESYRSILALAPDSIIVTRFEDGRYFQVNEAFCQNIGYRTEEVLGRTAFDLNIYVDPKDRNRVVEAVRRDGQVVGLEVELRRKDGSVIDTLISARLMRFQGEDCLLSILANVTSLKSVQNALRESEESYRSILALAPDSIVITRLQDGRWLQVNEAFCQHTGYSPEEVLGRTPYDLNLYADPADRGRVLEALRRDGRVDGFEVKIRRKDGTIEHELMSARIIQFQGEECILVVGSNITSLKAIQDALRESEEKYRNILETMEEGYYENDLAGNFTFCNETVLKFFGRSREEFIGTNYRNYMSAETAKRLEANFSEIYKTEIPAEIIDYEVTSRDGSVRTIELSASLVRNGSGDPIGFRGITRDMTERRKAELALRESEARFRTIFETASDAIFLYEMDGGRFLDVNRAGCKHLGYTKEELLHMSIREVVDPDEVLTWSERVSQVARNRYCSYESLHVRKGGMKVPVEISSGIMEQEGREVILSIIRDITERRRTEAELAKYREHLEERVLKRTRALEAAQKELVKREKLAVLGQLTATVSHELRNPLGVIRSSNFYLQRKVKTEDEKVHKHFNRIEDQVGRCDAIVGELLEYSRGRRVEPVETEMHVWLDALLDEFVESEKIRINKVSSSGLPSIPHDQEKMRRVMINVVDNAIQAVKAKEEAWSVENIPFDPEIRVTTRAEDDGVIIEVADNGIGMDENTRERAFEPLFTTRAKGTGIGLANVQKIVTEHGGAVTLKSDLGKGTTVTIKLPRKIR